MIDLYNRILPIICNHQLSKDRALEIARHAEKNDVNQIIAAINISEATSSHPMEEVQQAVETFNAELTRKSIKVNVLSGQLVPYSSQLVNALQTRSILTLNHSRYLLIDLPDGEVPVDLAEQLYQLQLLDIVPILSKPERNRFLIEQPDLIYKLVKQGVLMQVLSSSITGKAGTYIKRTTEQMINCNLVHFITSDTDRPKVDMTSLHKALHQIESRYGTETMTMLQQNLKRVINDQEIPALPPERFKRKRYIGLFR
ncbi:CpsB/CapC family capsule biosynthesis tyrosine phosphatase [Alkalicoccobacillus gibsonii]|uniref:Tyrosine-protein phosphatase n=1 Tax=Alkalicoccobacillus gibsonii TaxID=79881 RepID=A0ABU9VM38_9BACI